MHFLKKFKSVVFLLIAALFFGQALSYANISKAESGPLYITTDVRNKTTDSLPVPQVNAKPGDEITLRLFVKNQSDTETITNVNAKIQLDNSLEYIPGKTVMVRYLDEQIQLPDGITTANGISLPELPVHQGAYIYVLTKVKAGATGTLSQTSTLTLGGYTASDSTAKVVISTNNDVVAPKMVVDTKAVNLGTNPHPGDYPDRGWADSVSAKAGETIGFYVLTLNDKPADVNSRLKEVKVRATVDKATDHINLIGSAIATNHGRDNDTLRIDTKQSNKLVYISNSARLYYTDPSGDLVSRPLDDKVITSDGVLIDDVIAGGQAQGKYVYFQMRVDDQKTTGTIQLEKHLWVGNGWSQDPHPDKQVDFVLTFPDGHEVTKRTDVNGAAELTDVPFGDYKVREIVPAGYEQVELDPADGKFSLSADKPVFKVVAQNKPVVLTSPSPSPSPSVSPSPSPSPSVSPSPSPSPSVSPSPSPSPSVSPSPSPSPSPSVSPSPSPTPTPALQLWKFVGNANRNEAANKTTTKAYAGDTVNWRVVVKNVGNSVVHVVRLNDMLPANVRVAGDFVITVNGQRARLQDFTREFVTIGDLTPGQEVTVEFGTVISRDVVCGNQLTNTAFAESAETSKLRSEAKVQIECVAVAAKQQPLVKTGANGLIFSMLLSLLSVTGYFYSRQRKTLEKLTGRI